MNFCICINTNKRIKGGEYVAEIKKLICVNHGGNPLGLNNFYIASEVSMFKGIGYIPICKKCLFEMANSYYDKYKDMKLSIYYMCRKIDIAFNSNIFEGAFGEGAESPQKVFQSYITQYNSLGRKNNIFFPFDEGEHVSENKFVHGSKEDIDDDDSEVSIIDVESSRDSIKMNKNDVAVKKEIITMLEYDPFEGYVEADQKFLYNELYSYFNDEEVIEDQFLVSQLIQIANNNNQIRKIDYLISKYTANTELLIKNDAKIKSLNSTKKDIVQSTNNIAKENSISVKNRKSGNINKSSLTVMMEYLRELNFEDAEIDFYDQKKAYGMQMAADISMKAIAEQIQFDENDINEIIIEQRNMIKSMEEKILDLEEDNRQLRVEINNYKKNN